MEPSEFLTLIGLPAGVGILAALIRHARSAVFWALPLLCITMVIAGSFVLPSDETRGGAIQSVASGLVFCGLPTVAAFAVARQGTFRQRRIVAAVAAALTYAAIMFVSLVAAVNAGILRP